MKILITALIFCIFSANVFAKEKILDYFVIIDVQDDNSAIITERMIVNVETKKIKLISLSRFFALFLENNRKRCKNPRRKRYFE